MDKIAESGRDCEDFFVIVQGSDGHTFALLTVLSFEVIKVKVINVAFSAAVNPLPLERDRLIPLKHFSKRARQKERCRRR